MRRRNGAETVPRNVRNFIALSAIAAAVAVVAVIYLDVAWEWAAALTFGVFAVVAEQFPITVPIGSTYSVSFVLAIATMIVAGAGEAAIATMFGAVSINDIRRKPFHRNVFNAAQLSLSAAAAGLVYVGLGGPVGRPDEILPDAIFPLVAATIVYFLINTLLVSAAVAMSQRRPVADVWRSGYGPVGRTYVAFAALGLLLGVLYMDMGAEVVLFLLMPLLVARHAFQAAVSMENAYDATVRSLVKAIEAKDPYTSGHAGRVAQLAEMVARAYGLPPATVRQIRYAALMHDVGKLVVLNKVLQKSGKLTADEYEHMKSHPLHGVEIVSEIELLEDGMAAVRHHHERIDGGGYPDGLTGQDIPLVARLVTVCDAFDSMTSTRSYRRAKSIEDALVELHRCEGSQFDPAAIQALERAIEREGWEPHPETEELFDTPPPVEDEDVHAHHHRGEDADGRAAAL